MERLHVDGYNIADHIRVTLTLLKFWIQPGSRILDFGCGAGGLVYDFIDRGCEAHGFDIHDYVQYRREEDHRLFRFQLTGNDESDSRIDPAAFRLPYEDAQFDLVISTSVLEHMSNIQSCLAEIARVLKPTGAAFHIYPGIDQLIEPHVLVPLATRVQTSAWFRLWASLGIRNAFQEGQPAEQVAESNLRYSSTSLNYMPFKTLREEAGRYFYSVEDATRELNYGRTMRIVALRASQAFKAPHPYRALAAMQKMSASLMYNKIAVPP